MFPFLWILVVNDLLKELQGRGSRVIAYADDVALMIKRKFVDTVKGYRNVVAS